MIGLKELAQQFNGCTSNCGSVCHYIVDLSEADYDRTITGLKLIGATKAVRSLEESRTDRLLAKQAFVEDPDGSYQDIAKRIDARSYESEAWDGWYF